MTVTELVNQADKFGLAFVIAGSVIFMIWRFCRILSRKIFGRPDANPPEIGLLDRVVEADIDSKKRHAAANESNDKAIVKMSQLLEKHDGFAQHRTMVIDDLMNIGQLGQAGINAAMNPGHEFDLGFREIGGDLRVGQG